MRRLFFLFFLMILFTGCGESMKEKEEKAERLRRESQALLADLTKSKEKKPKKQPSKETTSEKVHIDTPASETEGESVWKNPYADYSDYQESPVHLAIKKRYEELFSDRKNNPNFDISSTAEQIEAYEKECDRIVGEEFGITPKEASEIYVKSILAATTSSKAQFDIFEYLKKYFSEEALPITVSNIEVNRDLSKANEAYIVLVHVNYLEKQKPEHSNATMSVIAQNIAIHLQLMEKVDFSDLVFFFRDDYNQRDLKLTAEWDENFRGFFKTGIWY